MRSSYCPGHSDLVLILVGLFFVFCSNGCGGYGKTLGLEDISWWSDETQFRFSADNWNDLQLNLDCLSALSFGIPKVKGEWRKCFCALLRI